MDCRFGVPDGLAGSGVVTAVAQVAAMPQRFDSWPWKILHASSLAKKKKKKKYIVGLFFQPGEQLLAPGPEQTLSRREVGARGRG